MAWATSLKNGSNCFPDNGPFLKWWRGFSDRHTELSLRHSESVDHGRVGNASPSIVQYLKVLKQTLEENALIDKPHLIIICDEATIYLNKSNMKCITGCQNNW